MSYPFLPDPIAKEKGTIEFPNNSTEYLVGQPQFTFDRLESPMPDQMMKSSLHLGTPLTPGIFGVNGMNSFTSTTVNSKFIIGNKDLT